MFAWTIMCAKVITLGFALESQPWSSLSHADAEPSFCDLCDEVSTSSEVLYRGKSLNLCMSSHTYIFFPNTPQIPESEKEGKTSMFLQGRSYCLCITYQIKSTTVMAGCFQRCAGEYRCHSTNAVSTCLLPLTLEEEITYILYFLLSRLTSTCEGASEPGTVGEVHVQVLDGAEKTLLRLLGEGWEWRLEGEKVIYSQTFNFWN